MTESEDIIRKRYENLGFTVVHRGAPDFLIFNHDNKTDTMTDIQFVEVKRNGMDWLSLEQLIWRCALETMHCKYKVEKPDEPRRDNYFQKNFTTVDCPSCKKEFYIAKEKLLEKIREMNRMEDDFFLDHGTWLVGKMIEDYKENHKKHDIEG